MEAVKDFASITSKIKRGPSLSLNKSSSIPFGKARAGKALQTIGSDAEVPVSNVPEPKKKKSLQEVKECMKTNFGASTSKESPKKMGNRPTSSTPKVSLNVAGKEDPQLASPSKKDKRVLSSDEEEEFVDNDELVVNFRPFVEHEKKLEAAKQLPRKKVKKDLIWEMYDDLERQNVQLKSEVRKLKTMLKKRNGGKVLSEDESD
ncbi:uncharacterized protein LOC113216178 [Frankliniella occidentalis]|uniref:Uncharacterized protein LOC113216178 n=1 Tax=Frankliniella occidentalis TaxID=133901 RepID=A0A9C6XCM8_FRAOC|nr:uncharacterized protein LOC113216178 [Frankliniella occidentalis]